MGKHDHVTGRPRNYVSRKWFHRGRHTPNAHRESVEEICAGIDSRDHATPGWHISADGKYFIGNVTIRFPDHVPDNAVMIVAPPGGLANIPALVTDA